MLMTNCKRPMWLARRAGSLYNGPLSVRFASSAAASIINDKMQELARKLAIEDAYMSPLVNTQGSSDVHFGSDLHLDPTMARLRIVPNSMSFYMSNPGLEDALRIFRAFIAALKTLPCIPLESYKRPAWIDPNTLFSDTKQGLSKSEKENYYGLLDRLNQIDPHLQPAELRNLLYKMLDKDHISSEVVDGQPKVVTSLLNQQLDANGRSITVGRRKSASARAIIARADTEKGDLGQILVNGESMEQYFTTYIQREEIMFPLKVSKLLAKLNIFVTVQGGGFSSQATAVGLAIAKGICVQNPLLIDTMLNSGCLLTDTRKKERKKPGKAKARKSYGWVKR